LRSGRAADARGDRGHGHDAPARHGARGGRPRPAGAGLPAGSRSREPELRLSALRCAAAAARARVPALSKGDLAMPFEGDLSDLPLADVLRSVEKNSMSGELSIHDSLGERRVAL